ncbi:hypothetical protein BGL55_00455 [Helicobacter pylori]|uniref:hypothetical protein n=1 Tax=Helicobacter pylori TaxID=210 RepID=UPI0009A2D7C4|nr:hypothetical protein [Helicobacter pylori]OPG32261.1 hypothetical protein BGL55_00455 [Helicobacter pylori]
MELEKLQPIDLEVLQALNNKAYLPKTADKISKDLNIDYANTLEIFNKLEKKGLCDQWIVNYKVCFLNDLGKDLCTYLKALKGFKNHKKD